MGVAKNALARPDLQALRASELEDDGASLREQPARRARRKRRRTAPHLAAGPGGPSA